MAVLVPGLAPVAPPAEGATLFGLVDTGELFASEDDGATWTVHATLPVRDAVSIAAGATSSDLYLVSRSGSVYRSDDGGNTWTAVGAIAASDVCGLTVGPDQAVMLLTESGLLFTSTDGGVVFTGQGTVSGHNITSLTAVSPDTLYTLSKTGEVYRSTDGGGNWAAVGAIPISDGANLRVMGTDLYVLTGTGGIYRSDDRGSTWMPIGTLSQVHMVGFTSDGALLYAATREGEVASSADGETWTWRGSINQVSVMALGTDVPASGIPNEPPVRPPTLSIGQNYPNPLKAGTDMTYIPFEIEKAARVELTIYDSRGRLVRGLFAGEMVAGTHKIPWRGLDDDGRRLPAGVYYYELRSRDSVCSRKAILVR
jgi:photosystem II stability/assembly factor-like uncharacterized protein